MRIWEDSKKIMKDSCEIRHVLAVKTEAAETSAQEVAVLLAQLEEKTEVASRLENDVSNLRVELGRRTDFSRTISMEAFNLHADRRKL